MSTPAIFAAAYLSGKTAPVHEDNETNWKELLERLQKVITYLDGFKDNDFATVKTTQVKQGWAKGKGMPAEEYLNEVAIPNFYFHEVTVYAILRHAGVDLVKMDYLGSINMRDQKLNDQTASRVILAPRFLKSLQKSIRNAFLPR